MTLESLIQAKSADFMEHHGYLFDGPDQVYEGVMAFLTSSLKEAYLAGIEAAEGRVREQKQWVFIAPYGLEMELGKVIPRKRTDDEYIKARETLSSIKSLKEEAEER